MEIEIHGAQHKKNWLLTTHQGQDVLARAKESSIRPRCACNSGKPEMYIAKRGELYYLARMPGTSKSHAEDCQSHLVPDAVYEGTADSPHEILTRLWQLSDNALPVDDRDWAGLREAALLASREIMVDGFNLTSRMLIPATFVKEVAEKRKEEYRQFYAGCDDDDGANRYWTFGIVKELRPSKYSMHMLIRHMPGMSFWVQKDRAATIKPATNGNLHLALFVCRPVKSGIAVSDIAVIELTKDLRSIIRAEPAAQPAAQTPAVQPATQPVAKPASRPVSDEDKLEAVTAGLGLPAGTPRREVIEKLIDHFLGSRGAS